MPIPENLCYNCFRERESLEDACPYCGYDDAENARKYPTALKTGSVLNGQYIVGRVLGQGGFGITYLSLDWKTKERAAIKEYLPESMATRLPGTTLVSMYRDEKEEDFKYGAECFLTEARVLAQFMDNPNIVHVQKFFDENNTSYLVMDYIDGISFKSYIKNKGGKIGWQDALTVLTPVLYALEAVHRAGLVHRDVTPDNIFITKCNEVKLMDFGSARYSLGDKSQTLDMILKEGYAPMEQCMERSRQGAYTDVYSVAACFYATITGFLPPESLERLNKDELIPIHARGIEIPSALEAAILKGLSVKPGGRFQNAKDFLHAIGVSGKQDAPSDAEKPNLDLSQRENTPPYTPQSQGSKENLAEPSDQSKGIQQNQFTSRHPALVIIASCILALIGSALFALLVTIVLS